MPASVEDQLKRLRKTITEYSRGTVTHGVFYFNLREMGFSEERVNAIDDMIGSETLEINAIEKEFIQMHQAEWQKREEARGARSSTNPEDRIADEVEEERRKQAAARQPAGNYRQSQDQRAFDEAMEKADARLKPVRYNIRKTIEGIYANEYETMQQPQRAQPVPRASGGSSSGLRNPTLTVRALAIGRMGESISVPARINNVEHGTPVSQEMQPNSDNFIEMAEHASINGATYAFANWADGYPQPARRIRAFNSDIMLDAFYKAAEQGQQGQGAEEFEEGQFAMQPAGGGQGIAGSLVIAVESAPYNGTQIAIDGRPMQPAGRTPAFARVRPNTAHTVVVAPRMTAPNGNSLVFEKWDDGVTAPQRQVVVQDKSLMMRASYVKKESRPDVRAYSTGTGTAVARLGERLETNVEARRFNKSPKVQMAINKGMRVLDAKARLKYRQLVKSSPERQFSKELGAKIKNAKRARKAAAKAQKKALNAKPENAAALQQVYVQAKEDMREAQKELEETLGKGQGMLQQDMRQREAEFMEYVKEQAADIAVIVSRKYGVPPGEQQAVAAELDSHAMRRAGEYFGGKSAFGRFMSTSMRNMSGTMGTIGSFGENVFGNLWALITGPWTQMSVLVLIQFLFTMTFVGYVPQVLYMMPIIAGAFTFLLNFSDTMQPLDWLTHFASGAAIGYSAAFLLIALGAHKWSFIGGMASFGFWIAWIILAFLGIFQFYQTGGNK